MRSNLPSDTHDLDFQVPTALQKQSVMVTYFKWSAWREEMWRNCCLKKRKRDAPQFLLSGLLSVPAMSSRWHSPYSPTTVPGIPMPSTTPGTHAPLLRLPVSRSPSRQLAAGGCGAALCCLGRRMSEGTMSGHGSAFPQWSYCHKLWCLVGGSNTYISPQYLPYYYTVLLKMDCRNAEGAHRFMPLYTETLCALWWFTHVPQQPPKKKHNSIRKAPVHETTFAG